MVDNGRDSNMDQSVVATGPSSDMASIRKEDPSQWEPADKTNGHGPTGIARAKGTDADEGTITYVRVDDRGQVCCNYSHV